MRSDSRSIAEIRAALDAGTLGESDLARLAADPRVGVQRLLVQQENKQRAAELERQRLDDLVAYEKQLWRRGFEYVAGVDEAGAGPLAGPVVAAAVILPRRARITGIDDSKKLSARQRERLALQIRAEALAFAVGACSPDEIDRLNILQASREAMRRAVAGLNLQPQHLLVDAREVPGVTIAQTSLIKGDACSQSIAAASILAKVERDHMMLDYSLQYPGYGFERHAGYGTAAHMTALRRLGPSPIHRMSFSPVAAARQDTAAVSLQGM